MPLEGINSQTELFTPASVVLQQLDLTGTTHGPVHTQTPAHIRQNDTHWFPTGPLVGWKEILPVICPCLAALQGSDEPLHP